MRSMSENPTETWQLPAPQLDATNSSSRPPLIPLRLRREPTGEAIEIAAESAVVGRHSESDVRLNDADVSRRHCRIALEDGLWRVRDLESTNGIFLNGVSMKDAVLYPGDRLRIGSAEFVVERAMPQRSIKGAQARADALRSIARAVSQ
jgi:pSer/pThr/pTyr-binding forkhead associated (FHA) protein